MSEYKYHLCSPLLLGEKARHEELRHWEGADHGGQAGRAHAQQGGGKVGGGEDHHALPQREEVLHPLQVLRVTELPGLSISMLSTTFTHRMHC